MKRILAVLLSMALAFGLVACGGNEDPSDGSNAEGRPVLRVGMECAYAPYNWAQTDDSNGAVPIVGSQNYAYGYDVMMAQYLANEMGYDLEIYQMDWDSLVMAVQTGQIDCAIAGQSITSERLESVDFTTPYYYASIVCLVREDSDYATATGVQDLAGATGTSQLNTVWYDVCLPQVPNANILPAMETAPAMMVALNAGSVDLVVTDMPTAMAAVVAYPNFVLLDFTEGDDNFEVSEEEINIGISVAKDNTQLLEDLNAALATLTPEDFERMMNDAIAAQPLSA